MSVMQEIKKEQVQARKNRDEIKSNTLTTLMGEAEMIGKNAGNRESTDEEVIAVVNKFIKNINETVSVLMKASVQDSVKIERLNQEKLILSVYIPKQLTEDELLKEMQKIVTDNSLVGSKSMGLLMKELKIKFGGQYDGKLASTLARQVFQ